MADISKDIGPAVETGRDRAGSEAPVTLEDLRHCITDLRQELARELAGFPEKLADEIRNSASLVFAETGRGEFQRLEKIDTAASALAQLEREYGRRTQELEAEMAAVRAAWADDQARARLGSAARIDQEIAAVRKEAETERRISELRIKSLEETVARQQAQLQARAVSSQGAAHGLDLEAITETISKRIMAHVQRPIDDLRARISSIERHAVDPHRGSPQLESAISALRRQFEELHANMAADLFEFETNMKAQAGIVESTRTAMAQTDDLVERVVEALERMQSAVLGESEDRAAMAR